MTVEESANLIDAVTKLLGVLVWPAIVLFVLVRFGPALREFFASLGEFSLKGAGFEASARRKQAEAAGALAAAAVSRREAGATPEATAQEAKHAVEIVTEATTSRALRRAAKSTVLWVDDRPDNNVHERQALEALDVNFVLSTSTDDALDEINRRSFDVIISDMGRPSDPQAGYTLLDRLRTSGNQTPFIIYAGSRAPEHWTEAQRRGALGCTNRPAELFELVLSALRRRA
jgi:CheY-like chemotaxis protein